MSVEVTRILAEWVHALRFEDIPDRTLQCAKEQIVGIIAATYAGSRSTASAPLYAALRDWEDRPESTVVGAGFKSSMRHAGMANAFAAQILEWEDYLLSQHTGASTVPTALAVAEAAGASGRDLLTALVAGNEVSGRTGQAYIKSRLYTNSCPNHQIDAALVAGKLLGLDATALTDAVGISCFPPMTQCFAGWFSPTKGMVTGAPVYAGISAASLAAHGFKGFRAIIEHPDGFSNAIFERYELEVMVEGLGEDWRTDTHSPKLYPCCGWLDALVDSALDLLRENAIDWRDIEEVLVRCPTVTLLLSKPVDELVALIEEIAASDYLTSTALFFNSTYPLAVAIADGELTEAQFSKERMVDAELRPLFERIRFTADPFLDKREMDEGVNAGEVTFRFKDGRSLSRFTEAMRGSYQNPIDIRDKLYVCTRNILDDAQRQELLDTVMGLDALDDVKELTTLLA
ncbi:MAG: MmgE/PrpD family protein [Actinomycetota bacterium]|nr:MmgE/PrpD family protein [Actinomycetota bacterium]